MLNILCGIEILCIVATVISIMYAELYALIPGGVMLAGLVVLLLFYKDSKWLSDKLIFALDDDGLYFTSQSGDGSYFSAEYGNISCFTAKKSGQYHTVTVYFKLPENAGIRGDLKSLKMIKIERFDDLKEILLSHGIKYGKN
ncbi:MAG: hypothetical protein K2F90_02235 [Clostridiales bacterium]|nr:hypothetical protein [Clostridiales bacterium]